MYIQMCNVYYEFEFYKFYSKGKVVNNKVQIFSDKMIGTSKI